MRKLTGFWRHVVTALSVMLVLFQLYTAGFGVFPDIVQRSVHLFFVLTMLFLLMPANKKKKTDTVPWYDVVLSMICMVCTGYMILIYEKILWDPSQWINSFDKICACLLYTSPFRKRWTWSVREKNRSISSFSRERSILFRNYKNEVERGVRK